jgi:hypothetical protein
MGTPHFWPRFLTGPGLTDLTDAFSSLLVDSSAPPSLDAVLDCRAKESKKEGAAAGVRKCVASVGMLITEEGPGSILILRVLPCGRRDLGVGVGMGRGKKEGGREEGEPVGPPKLAGKGSRRRKRGEESEEDGSGWTSAGAASSFVSSSSSGSSTGSSWMANQA